MLLIALLINSQLSHAIGISVIDDISKLNDIGFQFEKTNETSDDVIGFTLITPKNFGPKGAEWIKPLDSISYFHPLDLDNNFESLMTSPGSWLPLEFKRAKDGICSLKMSVMRLHCNSSYLVVTYSRGDSGAIPHLIYIPLSTIHTYLNKAKAKQPKLKKMKQTKMQNKSQ